MMTYGAAIGASHGIRSLQPASFSADPVRTQCAASCREHGVSLVQMPANARLLCTDVALSHGDHVDGSNGDACSPTRCAPMITG